MNGRLQDPIMGRMLSADPILGDLTNPQTLNRYSYVINNPASLTDPSGYWFASCENNIPTCTVVYDAKWSDADMRTGTLRIEAETARVGTDEQGRRYQLSEKEREFVEVPFGELGSLGMSHDRNASWLRLCVVNVPGPVRSTTKPSPENTVLFQFPTLRTLKPMSSVIVTR